MNKPCKAEEDLERGTVLLYFAEDGKRGIPHRMRGGIVWPIGLIPGYCLTAGQTVARPQVLTVFEEYPFFSVGSVNGKAGIWKHLTDSWKNYRCTKFYYHPQEEHLRFSLQVARESLIAVKPSFVEAELAKKSESNVDNIILEYQEQKRLRIDRTASAITTKHFTSGNLYEQLQVYKKGFTTNEDRLPAVRALRALVAGLERTPYRVPMEEQRAQPSYY